ncbi:MAG: family 16 glycoside hydrolase, partial [Verrucomicrobiia bacterium]
PNRTKQYNANLRTKNSYSSFRLQVEYRWLDNRFQPRHGAVRDAGILFHIHTDPDSVWPPSVEMQLGGGEPGAPYVSGDIWIIGNTRAKSPAAMEGTAYYYKPEGPIVEFSGIFPNEEASQLHLRRGHQTTRRVELGRGGGPRRGSRRILPQWKTRE